MKLLKNILLSINSFITVLLIMAADDVIVDDNTFFIYCALIIYFGLNAYILAKELKYFG